jgi:pyruvate dehydrogenase (quinone)
MGFRPSPAYCKVWDSRRLNSSDGGSIRRPADFSLRRGQDALGTGPVLNGRKTEVFLKRRKKGMEDCRKVMKESATRRDVPMKPQVIAHELGQRLANNAIVSCDSGTITTWWARHIPVKAGQMHGVSGNLASMACGLPYTLAAQIAYPNRQCVAFVGDGGFSMLMAEFVTAVKYKLPIKVVIVKNGTLGQIKWEQMVFLGNPEFGVDLQPT